MFSCMFFCFLFNSIEITRGNCCRTTIVYRCFHSVLVKCHLTLRFGHNIRRLWIITLMISLAIGQSWLPQVRSISFSFLRLKKKPTSKGFIDVNTCLIRRIGLISTFHVTVCAVDLLFLHELCWPWSLASSRVWRLAASVNVRELGFLISIFITIICMHFLGLRILRETMNRVFWYLIKRVVR